MKKQTHIRIDLGNKIDERTVRHVIDMVYEAAADMTGRRGLHVYEIHDDGFSRMHPVEGGYERGYKS